MENNNVMKKEVEPEFPLGTNQVLQENQSKLENLSIEFKREKNVAELLIKKEEGMEMGKKGRLVKLRVRNKMTVDEINSKVRARLINKLTKEVADEISDQWKYLETGKGQKDQKEGDWIIKNLLSLGLT